MPANGPPSVLNRRQLIVGAAAGAAGLGAYELKGALMSKMPTLYIPHGGGPCFFMEWTMGPPDTWARMAAWLGEVPASLPSPPTALLVVSAHWETPEVTVLSGAKPPLLYDYSGFPPHTYALEWPAPGAPAVSERVRALLGEAGIQVRADASRGFDHGVFVPMKVSYPEPKIPTLQLSLKAGLDPAAHLAIGRALSQLRDEGVFIVGSGMSYHNMGGFMRPQSRADSVRFDDWLETALAAPTAARDDHLTRWASAPAARACHPREEHLLPLMVCAGAAGDDAGRRVFRDEVMGVVVSAFQFG